MRRLTLVVPASMGALCGVYAVVYLVRWEWNRAIIAGVFFLAVEIMVVGMVIVERIRRVEQRLADLEVSSPTPAVDRAAADGDPLAAIRAAAPPPADRFAWMRDSTGSMGVFLPVLLGAGVLASALAWVVEHVARATVTPTFERRLAGRLAHLALPPGGLLGEPMLETTGRSVRSRTVWRRAALGMSAVSLVGGAVVGIDALADMTQTRPDVMVAEAQTVVDLTLSGAVADHDPDRVIGHLWAVCTGPDVFRTRQLPEPVVSHSPDGTIRVVVGTDVGAHGIDRLRGCLNDATIEKVQAHVVGVAVG